jgi:hypothetical protein
LTQEHWLVPAGSDRLIDQLFRTAQVRQAVNALGKLCHDPPHRRPAFAGGRVEARLSPSDRAVNRRPGIALAALDA